MKGYIVFVSKQIFPAVQGIAWAQQNGFEKVVLLCTPNSKQDSEWPAKRIRTLCQELQKQGIWKEFLIEEPVETEFTPQAVTETIEQRITQEPGEWIINTTGGLKLMSFGSSNFAGSLEIHYTEIHKGWYKITKGIGNTIRADKWIDEPAREITDNIPIKYLANAQFPSDEYSIEISDGKILLPLVDIIPEIIQDIATDGRWDRAFSDRLGHRVSRGAAMEYFLFLLFKRLGIENVALNLIVRPKEGSKPPLEADVIANVHGSLRFLEAKTDRPPLPTLLKVLASLQGLSGIGGSIALYAPFLERALGDDHLAGAYRVDYWSFEERADLIPKLYNFLHGPRAWDKQGCNDKTLVELDKQFRQQESQLFRWVEPMVRELQSEIGGLDWSYFRIGNQGVLLWRMSPNFAPEPVLQLLKDYDLTLVPTGQTSRSRDGQQLKGINGAKSIEAVFLTNDETNILLECLRRLGGQSSLTKEALETALIQR